MFSERNLSEAVAAVHERHAPGALVVDCERDFETLDPAVAEGLAPVVDGFEPHEYRSEWLPGDAPDSLVEYTGSSFTVGMPGDGGVAWTRQTRPPVVLVKPRLDTSPGAFVEFLLAEALVQVGLGEPEQFLGFFGDTYPGFADACRPTLDPAETYQLAAACYEAYLGLQTRDVFADWTGPLFETWLETGERLERRLDGLSDAVARGETSFGDAAELACSAVKHAGELPAPFEALDVDVYLDHGPEYAVEWADRTVDALDSV